MIKMNQKDAPIQKKAIITRVEIKLHTWVVGEAAKEGISAADFVRRLIIQARAQK